VEQLTAKNMILHEHLEGALVDASENVDALRQAMAANDAHSAILEKQDANIAQLQEKVGVKLTDEAKETPKLKLPFGNASVADVMGNLALGIVKGAEQETALSSLISSLPDFAKGKQALEAYILQITEEQKKFDVMSRNFGVDVPIHTPYRGAFPEGGKAFDILADEIIAFAPIKNE
jgi:hypothetical protein